MEAELKINEMSADELKALISNAEAALVNQLREQRREVVTKMRELAASVGIQFEIIADEPIKSRRLAVAAPKYRNPANHEQTWSGRGKRPKWFIEAIDAGVDPESMKIDAAS